MGRSTCDNEGNLTSDGVRTYDYDHAHRLKQVTEGSLTTQFAYNGDGVRASKTVDSATTEYVVDLAATLPVVISDTDAIYLYGVDIIAEQLAGANRYYYVHDGLGSVRQLLDNTGQIAETYAYDPFGVPLAGDTVPNPWQFTGEAWDSGVELLYLRARYYQPETGRFVTKDPWRGDAQRPGTLNLYLYLANNPVNYADPSGLQGPDPLGLRDLERPTGPRVPAGYPDEFVDHRDLTIWLVEELRANGLEAMFSMRPFRYIPYPGCRAWWLGLWVRRVADNHTWDFKDQIEESLGQAIMLRHSANDYGWYEFSVPGNINFGYAGRAAGFPGLALHLGASAAEATDRAHKERGEASCFISRIPDASCPSILKVYLNPQWSKTLYDDPKDFWSVEFGVRLYKQHPIGLTVDQFRAFLTNNASMLKPSLVDEPSDAGQHRDEEWPYPRGHFNGRRSDFVPFG